MRVQSNQAGLEDGVFYFLSDHRVFRQICLWVAQPKDGTLCSTSLTLDEGAGKIAELRYSAWGETRYTDGSTPTQRRYTGQLEAEAGLYFYQARWYDPGLGRFTQPDSLVPVATQGVLAWDRYAYVNNSPINNNDPSGHWIETALDIAFIAYDIHDIKTNGLTWVSGLSLAADVAGALLPVVTGAGLAVRATAHADDVVDAAKAADAIIDAVETTNKVDDIVDAVSHGDGLANALSSANDVLGLKRPNLPNWPSTPKEMDDILGMVGKRIPDGLDTPSRNKIIWNPSDYIKITFEQHPYHSGAPAFHTGLHWHIEWPGLKKHLTYLPGQAMPK